MRPHLTHRLIVSTEWLLVQIKDLISPRAAKNAFNRMVMRDAFIENRHAAKVILIRNLAVWDVRVDAALGLMKEWYTLMVQLQREAYAMQGKKQKDDRDV